MRITHRSRWHRRPHLPRLGRRLAPDRDQRLTSTSSWLGGHRGLEGQLVPAAGLPLTRLWLRSLRTVDLSVATLLDPLRLAGLGAAGPGAAPAPASRRHLHDRRLRGHPGARSRRRVLRIPSLLWEGNRVAGPERPRDGAARHASAPSRTRRHVRRLPAPAFLTGTPIRELGVIDRATRARAPRPVRRTCRSCSSSVARRRCGG